MLCAKSLQLCLTVTLCTVAHQVPLSMGFSRQDFWSGVPFPPPGELPDPGIKPVSLKSLALAGRFFFTTSAIKHIITVNANRLKCSFNISRIMSTIF